MALAFDNHSSGDTGAGAGSLTFSHTTAGNNRILFVGVFLYQAGPDTTGDKVTGVTYNGVAMTQVQKSLQTGGTYNRYAYLYMLVAPATGANNVVISASDSTNRIIGVSSSYTGALQTGQPDSSNTNTNYANITSITTNTTVVASNCWLVGAAVCTDGTAAAGTGTTIRDNSQFTGVIADSNGVVGTGSQGLQWTCASQSDSGFNALVASIAPIPTTTGAAFLLNFV